MERMLEESLETIMPMLASFLPIILSVVLSAFVVNFAIRWFVFVKAGEKGWKTLIPFYSDYIVYKIAWNGKVYLYILAAQAGSMILTGILSAISPVLGSVLGVPLNVAAMGMASLAGMLMHFKMARAFGHGDFFGAGLWLFNSIFMTVLAFGESTYEGPVPGIIPGRAAQKAARAKEEMQQSQPIRPVRPAQPVAQQPVTQQQVYQQQYEQQYEQQQYAQQQYAQQQYAQQQYGYPQQEQQRAGRRAQHGEYYNQR